MDGPTVTGFGEGWIGRAREGVGAIEDDDDEDVGSPGEGLVGVEKDVAEVKLRELGATIGVDGLLERLAFDEVSGIGECDTGRARMGSGVFVRATPNVGPGVLIVRSRTLLTARDRLSWEFEREGVVGRDDEVGVLARLGDLDREDFLDVFLSETGVPGVLKVRGLRGGSGSRSWILSVYRFTLASLPVSSPPRFAMPTIATPPLPKTG